MADKEKDWPNSSEILACKCKNGTQDKKYGEGMRLHYRCRGGWRCSTCKTERKKPPQVKEKGPDDG